MAHPQPFRSTHPVNQLNPAAPPRGDARPRPAQVPWEDSTAARGWGARCRRARRTALRISIATVTCSQYRGQPWCGGRWDEGCGISASGLGGRRVKEGRKGKGSKVRGKEERKGEREEDEGLVDQDEGLVGFLHGAIANSIRIFHYFQSCRHCLVLFRTQEGRSKGQGHSEAQRRHIPVFIIHKPCSYFLPFAFSFILHSSLLTGPTPPGTGVMRRATLDACHSSCIRRRGRGAGERDIEIYSGRVKGASQFV
jgi:hypothetical protein